MKTELNCTHCGEKITEVKINTIRKKWWLFLYIPLMLVIFYPMLKRSFFKPNYNEDLVISDVRKLMDEDEFAITGLISNKSKNDWRSVNVEVEFFDKNGAFVTEVDGYGSMDVKAHAEEYFKIDVSESVLKRNEGGSMKVKVRSANSFFY